ncbi:TPA: hypothetical protein ACH9KE_005411, partial [Escherichia coli]
GICMKKQSKEVKTSGSEHREIMIEIDASKSTNGTGGGSIIEGSYTVYRCDGGSVPSRPFGPPFCP